MRFLRTIAAAIFAAALPCLAVAQTSPNLTFGQVPTPAQWNSYFTAKQDTLGFTPMNVQGGVFLGRVVTAPPGASTAGFNLTPGTTPASPANGDLWVTSSSIFARINGVTINLFGTPCPTCAVTNATNTFTANQIISLNATLPAAQTGMLLQLNQANGVAGRLEIDTYAASAIFTGVRANGTAASPTTLVANSEITSLNGWGYDGASRVGPFAAVRLYADGTWTSTSHPTYVCMSNTTATASAAIADSFCVHSTSATFTAPTATGASLTIANPTVASSSGATFIATADVALASFGAGSSASAVTVLTNRAFIFSSSASAGIGIYADGSKPIDFYVNSGARAGGFTSAGVFQLGLTGSVAGQLQFVNATTGGVTLAPVAGALGSQTINVPANSGTLAVAVTSPITLSATGVIGCASCITSAGITALTGDVTASGSGSVAATLATAQPGAHTWAASQTFTLAPVFTDQPGSRTALGLGTMATQAASAVAIAGGTISGLTSLGVSGATTITSASASCLAVGLNGATNPGLVVDCSTASQAAGLKITPGAASGPVNLSVLNGAALNLNASGSTVQLNSFLSVSSSNVSILGSGFTYNSVTYTGTTGSGALVGGTTPTLATPVINGLPTGTGVATANTASTLVARDGSGNFAAGTITASLTGHASLDLALTGGTMSGAIAMGGNNITGGGTIAGTAITASTSISSPIHTASGKLTFQSNGSTFAGSISTGQQVYFGTTDLAPTTGPIVTVSKNVTAPPAVGTPVGITGTAQNVLHLVAIDTVAADIFVQSFGSSSNIRYITSNGTAASRTATTPGGIAANFAYGYTGSVYVATAGFNVQTTDTFSGTVSGGRFDIYATATGTTGVAIGASIGAGLMLNTTTDPGAGGIRATGATIQFTALASDTAQTDNTVCVNSSGTLLKGTGTLGVCLGTSSERFKNRVGDLADGLTELMRLRPVNFYYNNGMGHDPAKIQYGFTAEAMYRVLPALVGLDPQGRPNTADVLGLVPIIVRSVQQIKVEVDASFSALKADNDNLREELANLRKAR